MGEKGSESEKLDNIIENQEEMHVKIVIPRKKSTPHVGIQISTKR